MDYVRKLSALAGLTLTAMAIAATGAVAQEATPVEVLYEPTMEHCPPVEAHSAHVIEGGCFLRVVGDVSLVRHLGTGAEVVVATCQHDHRMRIDEDGFGYLVDQSIAGPGPCVNVRPCAEPGGALIPWPFVVFEFGPNVEIANIEICLTVTLSATAKCSVAGDVPANVNHLGDHDYVIEAEDRPFPVEQRVADPPTLHNNLECLETLSNLEVDGHLGIDASSDGKIEIVHLGEPR